MELLQECYVGNNSLNGSLPAPPQGSWQNMQNLDLGTNDFSGEIPREFGTFESLVELYLYENNLAGSMPEEVCNLRTGNLRDLEVDCAEVDCSCCTKCHPEGFE
uniref:Uncharacterized protein n=1 Tax=Pseudictyota dubia TaxID=2749911 RepID=A0A6U2AH54_9STRA|eukprot:CAMPEP_0197450688 /NCGR_PEP_ID=MMETSP1175-20131217/26175_1 /TAXON_ID=1003142 /ORGANISM="Triceratium dubium, Strain CCMP147" /LENGTH=103 /DNA_ID=CAMNT_0042983161 /DNA_START=1 /DNA_END=312 /DNA_ORIENTATION=-